MKYLSDLSTNKYAWLLLTMTALGLELAALFYQYGLGLAPCIMCIYQRVAVWAIFIAGVVGYFGCSNLSTRVFSYALWGTGAIWGLQLAIEHVEIQQATNSANSFLFSCDIVPNFPTWAPLHLWFPALFEATGDCGDIAWQFLSYSMPEWMIVVYGIFTLAFTIVLGSRLYINKMI